MCLPEEQDLACDLYKSTSAGDGWAATCKTGWEWCSKKQGTPIPCCKWNGVQCDSAGHITILSLGGCNLQGKLTLNTTGHSIMSLPFLEQFHVEAAGEGALCKTRQGIGGELPADLKHASRLKVLGLYCNVFNGTLQALASLPNLVQVDAHFNEFTGPLPSFAKSMASLVYLSVANNLLTGPIPADYEKLSSLITFGVAYNMLSGPLDVVSKLPLLTVIYARKNNFTGTVPKIGSSAAVVDLDFNQFTAFPPTVCAAPLPGAYSNSGGCDSDWPNQPFDTCCFRGNPIRIPHGPPPCLAKCGYVPAGTVVNSWEELGAGVQNCKSSCTFVLGVGFTTPKTGFTQLKIDSHKLTAVSIYGGGAVIDARGTCSIIEVYGASLTLVGVTLKNGLAKGLGGGGVAVLGGGTAHLEDCVFIGNKETYKPATFGGGAVFAFAGSVTLVNCNFNTPGDTSRSNNDVGRCTKANSGCNGYTGTVTFACPKGSAAEPVEMTAQDLLVTQLPPALQVVHCPPKEE
jgi:hypothetical protein